MPIKTNREYRAAVEFRAAENEEYIVEGYATTFNEPYVLYSYDGVDYYEQVDRNAFNEADMRDVIMQYDHAGMVFARQKNGTLQLSVDDHGLRVRADLSKTEQSRQMWEAINTGLISEMSFSFTIEEDSYDRDRRLRTLRKIKRVYDVSAVSIPANPSTEISARAFVDGVIAEADAERLRAEEKERRKAKIRLLAKI